MVTKLENLLLLLIVVLLPSQVAIHFWPAWSYIHGLPIDYLAPTLYATDLLLIFLLGCTKSSFRLPLPLIVIAVINTAFSFSPINSSLFWLRLFEYYWFYKYLIGHRSSLITINTALLLASLWTCLLALWQCILNHSVGGMWSLFLGEHTFNISTPFIATSTLFGERVLRAYATFPHPNALAGFLVICFFLVRIKNRNLHALYCLLVTTTLLFTFSRTAIITLILVLLYTVFLKSQKSIIAGLFQSLPITERLAFQSHAITQVVTYPLTGIGLGNFISSLPATANLQPVHNIFLLLLTELGIPTTLYILYMVLKKINFTLSPLILVIVLTGLFDHYWLTLHQNQLLLTILLAYLTLQSKARWKN